MQLDHFRLIGEAEDKKDAFRDLVADVADEEGGILPSEAFFVSLCSSQFEPLRMLEVGGTRGHSTELLAKVFPGMPVICVEAQSGSPDVQAAQARTAAYGNVEFQFGDPREVLPRISKAGDFVMLDGQAGFGGLKFLFQLLATRKFEMAFIHDVTVGSAIRTFLQKQLPSTVYSDDPEFSAACHDLDGPAEARIPAERSFAKNEGQFGYGFGMACLPYDPRIKYGSLARKAGLKGLFGG